MAYAPIEPGDLGAGTKGNSAAWRTLIDNHGELYGMYGPPIVDSNVYVTTASASYVTVLEWLVPQNEDELDVRVSVGWYVTGGNTATLSADLTDDNYVSVDNATTTTTSGAYTVSQVDITPSNSAGSATPRKLRLQLKVTAGDAYILSVACHIVPATAATGTLASGFEGHHTGWYSADQPVPSEVCSRLMDAPPKLASDRPVTLVSLLDDITATSSRARHTTATSGVIAVFRVPADTGLRTYRIAYRIDRDGTATPAVVVHIGAYQFTSTSTGWTQHTQSMATNFGSESVTGYVTAAVTSGTGNLFLRGLQVIREPDA